MDQSKQWRPSYKNKIEFNTRVDPDLRNDFVKACQRNKFDIQQGVAQALKEWIQKYGDTGPLQQIDSFFSAEYMPTPAFFSPLPMWARYLGKHCNFAEIDDVERRAYLIAKAAKKAYYVHAHTPEGREDRSIDKRKLEAAEKVVQDEEEQRRLQSQKPRAGRPTPAGVMFEVPSFSGDEEVLTE